MNPTLKSGLFHLPACDPLLRCLFDPSLPNSPALWAVLTGNYAGQAVVDNPHQPVQCVLRTDATLTYFSRECGGDFLDRALAYFNRRGPLLLVWPRTSQLVPPGSDKAEVLERLEFLDADPNVLSSLRRQVPPGFRIQSIDAALLERCEWHGDMIFYAGSRENFLRHGLGVCLLRRQEILCEAYASALGGGLAEIGAITPLAWRGQGYAPLACAHLAEACLERGYRPYWSCDTDNPASMRVARKLGFRQERTYQVYGYDPLV